MLIKALRLRHLGHRIPFDQLRIEVPMIGMLRYEDQPHGQSSMVCLLMPVGGSTEPLAQLFKCRIKIEKRGLLIRGSEDVWQRKRRDIYPQTLWAWPITPEPITIRVIAPTTAVMNDLREATR
jgi:hypothetical protein